MFKDTLLSRMPSSVLNHDNHALILGLCENWINGQTIAEKTGLPLSVVNRILKLLWTKNKNGRAQLEKKWNVTNGSWDYRENRV
jgi:hypothetical protein